MKTYLQRRIKNFLKSKPPTPSCVEPSVQLTHTKLPLLLGQPSLDNGFAVLLHKRNTMSQKIGVHVIVWWLGHLGE